MAGDPFLSDPSRKRKRSAKTDTRKSNSSRNQTKKSGRNEPTNDEDEQDEEDLVDSESETENNGFEDDADSNAEELSSDEEFADENAADKRRRLAKQYLENLKQSEFDGDGDEFFDAQDLDDDIVSRRLQTDVAEQKGYIYKFIGDKVAPQLAGIDESIITTRIGSKNLTGMSVRFPLFTPFPRMSS